MELSDHGVRLMFRKEPRNLKKKKNVKISVLNIVHVLKGSLIHKLP